MKRKHWWIEELEQQQIDAKILEIKEQDKIREIQAKERTLKTAFDIEIAKKKSEIDIIQKQIKDLERMCAECLAKIHVGDSGLMEILEERNIQKLIQTQETKEQN